MERAASWPYVATKLAFARKAAWAQILAADVTADRCPLGAIVATLPRIGLAGPACEDEVIVPDRNHCSPIRRFVSDEADLDWRARVAGQRVAEV